MKIVAVSQRIDNYPDRNECRDALDQNLTSFVLESGFFPFPVPNKLTKGITGQFVQMKNELYSWLEVLKPSAFILSGGNDIGGLFR